MNNKKDNSKAEKQNRIQKGFIFSGIVLVIYIVLFFIDPDLCKNAFFKSIKVFRNIIPILIAVFVLIFAINMVPVKWLKKIFNKKRKKLAWFITIAVGILSHGPVFVWYTLLADLRKKGMTGGMAAAFIYARAVKLPIIPALIAAFGLHFTLIFYVYILIGAVIQGIIMDFLFRSNLKLNFES